jgi:hypothetical protein
LTAAPSRFCASIIGFAGLLLFLLGNASAQPAADIVPKLPDTKLEVIPGKPAPRPERPLELSPFVVSGDKRPWRYGTLPGVEVLTRADDKKTAYLLACYARSWQAENLIIPMEWLRKSPIPCTIIVDDTDPAEPGLAPVAPALTRAQNFDTFGWTLSGSYRGVPRSIVDKTITPGRGWIHAADEDTTVLGANLHGGPFCIGAPTWLDRLERCTPGLPTWLVAGLVGPQGLFENRTDVVFTLGYSNGPAPDHHLCAAIFRGIRWISTADSRQLKGERSFRNGTAKIPFIPLREFFSESPPPPEQRALWESQAGLLVRWGLLGEIGKVSRERRAKFVKFVERQRSEPVTEQMLIECFGRGYADLEKELKGYLRKTLGAELQFAIDDMIWELQPVNFSAATPDQVGRIMGDWQRMQGESLQMSEPAQAKALLDAADRTLSRAWLRNSEWQPTPGDTAAKSNLAAIIASSQISATGNPDPDFLAVCGLYEYDIGEYKLARDVLEIAAALHTRRPKAYLVLAELRAREATAKPAGRNGALSTAQAAYIFQSLKPALPPASSSRPWRLMVDTLVRCESTPSAENLDVVIKGAAQFPRDSSLQLDTARLCLKAAERERALRVIDNAYPLAVDEKVRTEFQKLRDTIRESL